MDDLDSKILGALMVDGRVTWSDLASRYGVSSPAISERVRRLEKRGIIQGYRVVVDAVELGYDITAFVAVVLEHPQYRQGFLDYVQGTPAIQECHHVAGDGDYLLKVRCGRMADLEQILSEDIKGLPGILQTKTSIALSTVKETTALAV
ncbi:Lrp/AsnC family transcriptional regulator [Leptolyngbyaceae cyanobacterium CCMR0082]|uniref:Lrp/AsnC family transcriptional regulator n=2 Tax=Adonisia turfae TaxID=2950184 RepID=A0A6M0SG14_9CYAN|nr:Lrp/AsnC family transcriptional regulator [Adonisia turfae]MDV3352606.1 Lrp/AsnC family transcriptional regulator [Leptothoe sp. LEGE 181152]NEZ59107.1 Lrp/AsnC family transcriptional regulator [Adonisia turfae CCMR0081]NEZ67354.1 Lrp/AsnC family transcriptional regulator [Adonisia turfae CCMR0082]